MVDMLRLDPHMADLGDGLQVRRLLPHRDQRSVGPFIFLDHFGPVTFSAGRGMDVRPHPHIGLATVTYLFEGTIQHRDSLGVVQLIRPGDVNLMTAGGGIVHSERSPREVRTGEQRLHGLQIWLALPAEMEEITPAFEHQSVDSLPLLERGGAQLRLIAGKALGAASPVRTLSPLFYLDVRMPPGSRFVLEAEYAERAAYVIEGEVRADTEGALQTLEPGALTVLPAQAPVRFSSTAPARLVLFGGTPLGHRFLWWNFASSRKERIEQAKGDWAEQRFAPVPGETEFIPLPETKRSAS